MICKNCGFENESQARFCVKCGKELSSEEEKREDPGSALAQKLKKQPALLGAVAAAVLVLVLVVTAMSGQGEKKVVDRCIKGVMTCDMDKILSVFPEEMLEMLDEEGISREYFKNELEDQLSYAVDVLKDAADDIKFSYKIKEIRDLDDTELIDIQDEYRYNCNLDVSDAEIVEVELNVSGEVENTADIEIGVIKIGRKWYLDVISTTERLW